MDAVRPIADRVAVMDAAGWSSRRRLRRVLDPGDPGGRRFVRSALHDRPSVETLGRLRERHPGRIVTIQVAETGCRTASRGLPDAGVDAELVFGGISELQERGIGR